MHDGILRGELLARASHCAVSGNYLISKSKFDQICYGDGAFSLLFHNIYWHSPCRRHTQRSCINCFIIVQFCIPVIQVWLLLQVSAVDLGSRQECWSTLPNLICNKTGPIHILTRWHHRYDQYPQATEYALCGQICTDHRSKGSASIPLS